ncbi:hypothetical protein NL108_008217 [Boleophthalmus pectinirostris]|nr:hypothetical protein NL108_008217 [Boleophthalmus pectinirostris]
MCCFIHCAHGLTLVPNATGSVEFLYNSSVNTHLCFGTLHLYLCLAPSECRETHVQTPVWSRYAQQPTFSLSSKIYVIEEILNDQLSINGLIMPIPSPERPIHESTQVSQHDFSKLQSRTTRRTHKHTRSRQRPHRETHPQTHSSLHTDKERNGGTNRKSKRNVPLLDTTEQLSHCEHTNNPLVPDTPSLHATTEQSPESP